MNNNELIMKMASENHGVIRSRDIEAAGIRKACLSDLVKKGLLEREERGIYCVKDIWADEYEVFQKKYDKCIFSFETALFFHGLSDVVHLGYSVSVPQGYNATSIKKAKDHITVHYVKKTHWLFGTAEIRTPQGGTVLAYDKERCICDLIKDRSGQDKQIFTNAIKNYFSENNDFGKLIEYASFFGIEEKVRTYMEVLR